MSVLRASHLRGMISERHAEQCGDTAVCLTLRRHCAQAVSTERHSSLVEDNMKRASCLLCRLRAER